MKQRILLADDDESVRKLVGRVLESAGYAVVQAATGREAASELIASRPDLVVLELQMPDQAGWDAFDSVRQLDSVIPVIATTAWPNQAREASRRGIDALIEKPLDLALLLSSIKKFLTESEPQREERRADREPRPTPSVAHSSGV